MPLLVLLVSAGSSASAEPAHLRFGFGRPGSPNYRGDRVCPLESMSWVDDAGRIVWTRPAPDPLVGKSEICECGKEDPSVQMTGAWRPCRDMVEASRSDGPEWLGFMTGVERREGVVALAHWDGVIAIAVDDGRIIATWKRPERQGAYVPLDHADYRLDGVRGCRGRTRGSTIVAWCGDLLLYFRHDAAVLLRGPTLRVVASALARERDVVQREKRSSEIVRTHALLRLGRYRLVIDGIYDSHP